MKPNIFFQGLITILFLLTCSSAANPAGMSPMRLEINLTDLNQRCEIVWIDFHEEIKIDIFWSEKFSNSPLDYDLDSSQIGVLFSYNEVSPGEYNFCFQGVNRGSYYGVTRVTSQNSLIALGNFISLNVRGGSKVQILTGRAIKEIQENNLDLWFIFLSLLIIFLAVLVNLFKRFKRD